MGNLRESAVPLCRSIFRIDGRQRGELSWINRDRSGPANPLIVSQADIEAQLRGRLTAAGGTVEWNRRVVDVDDTGERVAFGRDGAPEVDLTAAVMASCAIPGWYQPVRIGEHRYIDGGAWSSTNLDLMVGRGLDEVFVLAPQVSFVKDSPSQWRTRVERQWRNRVTLRALRELHKVHHDGAEVTMLGPGEEDLEAIGANLMDVSRRPGVIATSLRTSAAALHDPAPLPHSSDFEDVG